MKGGLRARFASTMLRKRRARGIFAVAGFKGFTVVEVLIVLAVTGALFVSAVVLVAGRQRQTEFNLAIREMQAEIQRVINEVAIGYYPNLGNITCTVSGTNPPTITQASGSEQGANTDCIFMGKVIQFRVAGTDPEQFRVYTLAGRRTSSDNPSEEATTRGNAESVVVAPSSLNPSAPSNNVETVTLPSGLTTASMVWGSGAANAGAVAFFQSLAEYDSGNLQSGAQHVNVVPISGTSLGMTPLNAANTINSNFASSPINIGSGTRICFASGTTNQSGLITIGSQGRQLSVTLDIKSNKTCA